MKWCIVVAEPLIVARTPCVEATSYCCRGHLFVPYIFAGVEMHDLFLLFLCFVLFAADSVSTTSESGGEHDSAHNKKESKDKQLSEFWPIANPS